MSASQHKLAFIGLGVMGFPMAGHLLKSGHKVQVYNRNPDKSTQWMQSYQLSGNKGQASCGQTIASVCAKADYIFTCVGNDDDLKEIMLGKEGVLSNAKVGAYICDHTTSSAMLACQLSTQAAENNLYFLDAPVSGGQAGAESGQLSIMVGGDEAAYQDVLPLLNCYGKTVELIGDSGSGQLAKMMNQICIAGILEGLSEALYFGKQSGIDLDKVLKVISQGAAQSWQMDNRASTMLENSFDFGFAVDWMRKDLAFVMDEAKKLNIDLPLVGQVDQYYEQVQSLGGGRLDTSSLITRFRPDKLGNK